MTAYMLTSKLGLADRADSAWTGDNINIIPSRGDFRCGTLVGQGSVKGKRHSQEVVG